MFNPKKELCQTTYFYTYVQIFGPKFKILSTTEIHHFLKLGQLTLNGPPNSPGIIYSKIQNRLRRAPLATPMD